MDALAVVLIFLGAFMVYEAYKNPSPTPVTTATKAVTTAAA